MTKMITSSGSAAMLENSMQEVELDINLSSLSKETFEEIVNQDVRGHRGGLDEDTSKALRAPENVDRWYVTLVALKRNVDVQMAAKKSELSQRYIECLRQGNLTPPVTTYDSGQDDYLSLKAQMDHWRQGALRFKSGLEDRIAEAKTLREARLQDAELAVLTRERDLLIRQVITLREGIIGHRNAVLANEDESEAADEELWLLVESETSG